MDNSLFNSPNASQFTVSTLLQTVSSVVLLIYLSLALGGAIISLGCDVISRLTGSLIKQEQASKIAEFSTGNFGVSFLFGIVPIITILAAYSQFLFGLNTPVIEYFVFAAAFNGVGLLFLNKYREAMNMKKFVHGENEAHSISESAKTDVNYSGVGAVFFLLLGSFFLVGGFAVAVDPGLWQNGFSVIFCSFQVWLKFFAFLCGAIGLTGVAMIFFFLSWDGGFKHVTNEIKESSILGGSTFAIVFIPLYVIFTGLHLKFIPRADFSGDVIIFSALSIFVLFITLHMVYYSLKYKNSKAGYLTIILFSLSFIFVVLADNTTRENALRKHTFELVKHSDALEHDKKGTEKH